MLEYGTPVWGPQKKDKNAEETFTDKRSLFDIKFDWDKKVNHYYRKCLIAAGALDYSKSPVRQWINECEGIHTGETGPLKLQNLCREVIRYQIMEGSSGKSNLLAIIPKLPIPKRIHQFLTYNIFFGYEMIQTNNKVSLEYVPVPDHRFHSNPLMFKYKAFWELELPGGDIKPERAFEGHPVYEEWRRGQAKARKKWESGQMFA